MTILSEKDYLEVKLSSLIADYDRDTITNLYQPIIGYAATAVYFSLWSEANNEKITSLIAHQDLLSRMQMASGVFVDARKTLEAIGLLKTYLAKAGDTNIYYYEVFAPKTPNAFFNDTLLYGLLIKYMGENSANKLKALYNVDIQKQEGQEISASFSEIFHPEFDDPAFMTATQNSGTSLGRNAAKILGDFSYEKFFEELSKISQISSEAFLKKDMKEIQRLSTLYGVKEEVAANAVSSLYDMNAPKGKRVDFNLLSECFQNETNFKYLTGQRGAGSRNLVNGNSPLATKINLMETTSPKDYLSLLQNGTKPAMPDLRLIDDLSKNFHLTNSVINATIDFVLTMNGNVLSRSYCEKVAASLAREGVETTIDAMNFLKKSAKKKKVNYKVASRSEELESVETKENSNDNEDIDWNTLVDSLDSGENDGQA